MLACALSVSACLLMVCSAKSRAGMGLNRDVGNLRQIGQWTHAFAADSEDRYPMLSEAPDSQWPLLRPVAGDTDLERAAKHAIDIIRRRTGREDFPLPPLWIAHLQYGYLALADYVDRPLPDRTWVSVGDVHRMNWTDDPVNKYDQGFWQPFQEPSSGPVGTVDKRWPYSSSYQTPPAWFDRGQSDWLSPLLGRIAQASSNGYIVPPDVELGGQPLSLTAFPSQKVMVHDYGDWHHAREARYFPYRRRHEGKSARVALLLADGAAGAHATLDANEGWHPSSPASPSGQSFVYTPRAWEPPTANGATSEVIGAGVYRWTRGGLLGRDFGGYEIDTGQYP